MALRAYEEGPLDAFLEREIRTSLEMTVVDEGGEDQISAFLASQANALLKASTEMAERLGREATVEELAKYLGI
jgi:DNA-directed RNA polymerase specialized sigma subunit